MADGGPSSRYHHFVPQFILRNWAHAYRPEKGKRKNKRKDRLFPGEKVLHCINLRGTQPELVERKVAKTFGIQDMYIDEGKRGKEQHVEELLSRLEARAAEVITKIRKAFERGDQEVALLRGERDTVRKFVFIMKYRGTHFGERFVGNGPEDYVADDRERFLAYMKKKGFKKPIDVWLDNIQAFIEVDMDVEREWEAKLVERCYPGDAWWFILNTTWYYLALCTPKHDDDEFLMTENGYGIHEGPVSTTTDVDTGEVEQGAYTEHHVFAHISPRLTMVLRSALLPLAVEDVDEEVKKWRELMNEMSALQHNKPESAAVSLLQDLPVTKPTNSYTTFVDGRPVPIGGATEPVLSKNDKFFFKFFPLSREHVAKINCVLLEEAYVTSMIAFNRKISACKALECYLTMDTDNERYKFKHVTLKGNDPRLQVLYLKKLEAALVLLGGKRVAAKYNSVVETERDMVFELISGKEEAQNIYTKLCQKTSLDPKDFEQARIMLKLRIKIDTWSQGLDENIRNGAREYLRDMYCELPIHRLWIYLKRQRFIFSIPDATILTPKGAVLDVELPAELLAGPEDLVAKLLHRFVAEKRCRIMYFAAFNRMNETKLRLGLKSEGFASDKDMRLHVLREKSLAFGSQGSICDCGVPHIEELSRKFRRAFQTEASPNFVEMERCYSVILEPDYRIELATRIETMNVFLRKLKGKGRIGEGGEEEDLLGLLFGIMFPIFGAK